MLYRLYLLNHSEFKSNNINIIKGAIGCKARFSGAIIIVFIMYCYEPDICLVYFVPISSRNEVTRSLIAGNSERHVAV